MIGTCKLCGMQVASPVIGASPIEAQQLYGLALANHLNVYHSKRMTWLGAKIGELTGLAIVGQFTHDEDSVSGTFEAKLAEAKAFFDTLELGELEISKLQVATPVVSRPLH